MRHSSIMIPEIRELLKLNNKEELHEAMKEMHPADIADFLGEISREHAQQLFSHLPKTVKTPFRYIYCNPLEKANILRLSTTANKKTLQGDGFIFQGALRQEKHRQDMLF